MTQDIATKSPFYLGDVAVLIPSYKGECFLAETLESVSAQSYPNWHLYIIEDGIFDDTSSIVERFALKHPGRVTFKQNSNNLGVSSVRNQLIELTNEKYLAFLDNDDLWDENHLENSIQLIHTKKADWVISGYRKIDQNGKIISEDCLPPKIEVTSIPSQLLMHNFILMGATLLRRNIFDAGLRFDLFLKVGEDLSMWIEIIRQGFIPAMSISATLNYRQHPNSLTGCPIRFAEEYARIAEKYYDDALISKRICHKILSQTLLAAARMTWRGEPGRCRDACARLLARQPWNLLAWLYLLLSKR